MKKLKTKTCEHSKEGLCPECKEEKPYMVFRLCKNKCLACNECGYIWGPGSPWNGEKPYWITKMRPDPKFTTSYFLEIKDDKGKVIKKKKILGQPIGIPYSFVTGTIEAKAWSESKNQWTYSIYPGGENWHESVYVQESSLLPIKDWLHPSLSDKVIETVNNLLFDDEHRAKGAMSIATHYQSLLSGRASNVRATIDNLLRLVEIYNEI